MTRCAGVIVVSCVISAWYWVVKLATEVMLLGVPVMSAIRASLLPIQRKMVVGCALIAKPSWLSASRNQSRGNRERAGSTAVVPGRD